MGFIPIPHLFENRYLKNGRANSSIFFVNDREAKVLANSEPDLNVKPSIWLPQAELTFKLPVDTLPIKSTPIVLAQMSDVVLSR